MGLPELEERADGRFMIHEIHGSYVVQSLVEALDLLGTSSTTVDQPLTVSVRYLDGTLAEYFLTPSGRKLEDESSGGSAAIPSPTNGAASAKGPAATSKATKATTKGAAEAREHFVAPALLNMAADMTKRQRGLAAVHPAPSGLKEQQEDQQSRRGEDTIAPETSSDRGPTSTEETPRVPALPSMVTDPDVLTPRTLIPADVHQESELAGRGISSLHNYGWWLLTLLLGGPTVSALASPGIRGSSSFLELFLGTLAWSLGVAVIAFAFMSGFRAPVPVALIGAGAVFVGTSAVAVALGTGALNDPNPCLTALGSCTDARQTPVVYAGEALETYGPLGFLIATAVGVTTARWAKKILAHHLS